jgi:hypothetical protein
MDLKYLIIKKKLEAQKKIFFDQLTLGERVESPQATKLPVKFAISLLKDRKGEIRLDIPMTGSLDDPKFSVFKIILSGARQSPRQGCHLAVCSVECHGWRRRTPRIRGV